MKKVFQILQASKSFSKAFMQKYELPTAEFESFTDAESAIRLEKMEYIKIDRQSESLPE